jgi:hypothetical protein
LPRAAKGVYRCSLGRQVASPFRSVSGKYGGIDMEGYEQRESSNELTRDRAARIDRLSGKQLAGNTQVVDRA